MILWSRWISSTISNKSLCSLKYDSSIWYISITYLFAMSNDTVRVNELTRTETAFINLLASVRYVLSTLMSVLPTLLSVLPTLLSVLPILLSVCHVIMFGIMLTTRSNILNTHVIPIWLVVSRTIRSHCSLVIWSWCRNFVRDFSQMFVLLTFWKVSSSVVKMPYLKRIRMAIERSN